MKYVQAISQFCMLQVINYVSIMHLQNEQLDFKQGYCKIINETFLNYKTS
jgi:hypothetical protein